MVTNYFLGKDFLDYGPTFFPAPEDMFARTDQLSLLFPALSKCIFIKYGSSGKVVHYN